MWKQIVRLYELIGFCDFLLLGVFNLLWLRSHVLFYGGMHIYPLRSHKYPQYHEKKGINLINSRKYPVEWMSRLKEVVNECHVFNYIRILPPKNRRPRVSHALIVHYTRFPCHSHRSRYYLVPRRHVEDTRPID